MMLIPSTTQNWYTNTYILNSAFNFEIIYGINVFKIKMNQNEQI